MTTNNPINNNLGYVTVSSLTFSPTTGGLVGVTDGTTGGAGFVGEEITSIIPNTSPVTFTTSVATDITSISLSPGQWMINGLTAITPGTSASTIYGWISTTSATLPDAALRSGFSFNVTTVLSPSSTNSIRTNTLFLNITTTTNVYLTGYTNGTGTINGYGTLFALRVR